MQTVRTIHLNLRDGSTGIELLSALFKIVLFLFWWNGLLAPAGVVTRLISEVKPSAWALLVIGVVHCAAWTQPPTLPVKVIRKGCSCVGLAIWTAFLYDLARSTRGTTAFALLVGLMMLFLLVAVFRRVYPAI